MRWYSFILAASVLLASGRADAATASGLVDQVRVVSSASGSQAKLLVTMRTEGGNRLQLCTMGSTAIFDAGVAANNPQSIALVQALLTAALMNQRSVEVVSNWNGSYCEIDSVTFKG